MAMIEPFIELGPPLAEAIAGMSGDVPAPPTGLAAKGHALTIRVFNQTQFELVFQDLYFDTGRTYTAPTNVPSFGAMSFSVCETDGPFSAGVSGGVQFAIAIPGVPVQPTFSAGFTNPVLGSYKASVVADGSAEEAYEAAVDTTLTARLGPLQGKDKDGQPVALRFRLVSQPGAEPSITVTQEVSGG